jgi:hypothetical protein
MNLKDFAVVQTNSRRIALSFVRELHSPFRVRHVYRIDAGRVGRIVSSSFRTRN